MGSSGISVIVCTHNRLDYLKKCLKSLFDLDFLNYEIVVINDGSNDGTKEYLDNLLNNKIKVFHNEKKLGLSRSRNIAISKAGYYTFAFTDDDCMVDKKWLQVISRAFENREIGFVMGQTFYIDKNYQGYFPERMVSNIGAKWPMGCNMAYQKEVFKKCGDFADYFFKYNNEDSEMAIRAVARGFKFLRLTDALVYHQAMNWSVTALLNSAKNASVWPLLKKMYPENYLTFGPPVWRGIVINPKDYIYILLLPVLLPVLLIRYVFHGKIDFKIFFAKWPVYLFLRRFYIYKEAWKNKVFIF